MLGPGGNSPITFGFLPPLKICSLMTIHPLKKQRATWALQGHIGGGERRWDDSLGPPGVSPMTGGHTTMEEALQNASKFKLEDNGGLI